MRGIRRSVIVFLSVLAWAGTALDAREAQARQEPLVAAYAEAYGNVGLLSVNMDLMFENGILVRFGGLPLLGENPDPSLDDSWKDEMDGVLLVTMLGTALGDGPVRLETSMGFTFGIREGDRSAGGQSDFAAVTATIGLRHQPIDEKIMFRVGFTPRYDSDGFQPGVGFSIGVTLDEPN